MPPILFSTIKRRALSMRSRRSLSVIGWMPAVVGRSPGMACGAVCDWPRAIATAPPVARNRLRSTATLIRLLSDDLGELIARSMAVLCVGMVAMIAPRDNQKGRFGFLVA